MNFQKSDPALASLDDPQILEIRRAQNRQRQLNKRRRDRADRIDQKLEAIVDQLPIGWRGEFRERVRAGRAREATAFKSLPDVAASMSPEAQKQFLALHKFSLTEASHQFIREKMGQFNSKSDYERVHERQIEQYGSAISDYADRPDERLRAIVERVFPPVKRIDLDAAAVQRAARLSGRYCNHVNLRHPAAPKPKINSVFFCRA